MSPDPGEGRNGTQVAMSTCDPASLPPAVAVRILALAYLVDPDDSRSPSERENDARWRNNPLRAVAPLVSRSWRRLLLTDEARAVLWRRARFTNACFARSFDSSFFRSFWKPRLPDVLEVDIDLEGLEGPRVAALCPELVDLIRGAPNLRALRLAGPLPAGGMLRGVGAERLAALTALSSVLLSGGAEEALWGLEGAVEALRALPALQMLEIRFGCEAATHVDPGILGTLCGLTGLRHLALQWPPRSALPPFGDVPAAFGSLTGLTALQLRRVPLQDTSPAWLGALTSLRHLYWDPWLPVDLTGVLPTQLSAFAGLETLYVVTTLPLALPPGLSSLRRLAMVCRGAGGHGCASDTAAAENGGAGWGWLAAAAPRLESLRLQGGGIAALPPPVAAMSGLTRLELMCNDLTAEGIPQGQWLESIRHLHLGGNCILSFPPVLRHATALRSLHLANQRAAPGALCGPALVPQRLRMAGEDVAALLAAPALETVVMGMGQPQVMLGGRTCDFDWLKRALGGRRGGKGARRRPIKLTSNELAFELEPMEVFKWQHLTPEELNL